MSLEDCQAVLSLVDEAVAHGCRQVKACEVVGIDSKTYQRWATKPVLGDQRRGPKTAPANKFTLEERAKIMAISTEKDFVNLSPHQIVPSLADRGEYVGSESSFYRILTEEKLMSHRGRAKPKERQRPAPYEATKPNQLYSWDITYSTPSRSGPAGRRKERTSMNGMRMPTKGVYKHSTTLCYERV